MQTKKRLNILMRHTSKLIYFLLVGINLLFLAPLNVHAKDFVLILDAGHGGKDPGALGTYSKEKNINLNVVLKVGKLIESNCPDVKVIYTRKTDVFIPLDERANIANKAKADLFISVHTNALAKGKQMTGSETYSLGMARAGENLEVAKRENSVILYEQNYRERYAGFNPNSAESYIIFDFMQDQYMKQSAELANAIQKQYASVGRPNKGVHQAGFLVLRETSMPSVLTELGFITTPSEEKYLNSADGINKLAQSIYNGFVEYKNKQTRTKTPTLSASESKTEPTKETEETEEPQPVIGSNQEKKETAPKEAAQAEEKQEVAPAAKEPKEATGVDKTAETSEKAKAETDKQAETEADNQAVVFKIQILTASRQLRQDASQLKGLKNVGYFMDKNIYKYTYGSTSSYQEISQLRKTILDKFPDCFIVAFCGKEQISVQDALKRQKP